MSPGERAMTRRMARRPAHPGASELREQKVDRLAHSAAAPARRSFRLWLVLAVGAAVFALLADAFNARPGPVLGSHLDRPYLPTEHLTRDLGR